MSMNEIKNLKSEILFGSSHCSCISCDSFRCFAKRKVKVKTCSCSVCKDSTACLYYSKEEFFQKENQYTTPSKTSTVKYTVNKVFYPKRKSNYDKSKQDNLKNDISQNRNVNFSHEHLLNKAPDKISIQNIFGRIKQIYSACSCKVCECVATKAGSTVCRCKPCECNNCKCLMNKTDGRKKPTIQNSSPYAVHNNILNETTVDDMQIKYKLHTSYKKYENAIEGSSTPKYNNCKCKPCDCDDCKILTVKINDGRNSLIIKNAIYNESQESKPSKSIAKTRSKSCDCKPCQCDKCKPKYRISNTFVVASMEDNLQRNACSCAPCECSSCRQASTANTTSLMREISTAMTETCNNNCQCEPCFNETCRETLGSCQCASRNSVMNKPFVKDTQNIDIHRALVLEENSNDENNGPNYTISVLTDVLNTYQEKETERKKCDCKKLDCAICSSNINMINSTGSLTSPFHNVHNLSTLRVDAAQPKECKCISCECQICDKYKRFGHGVWKSDKYRSKCDCDICRCLYCGDLLKSESTTEMKYDNVNNKSTLHKRRPINLLFPKIQCRNELTTKNNNLNKIIYKNLNNNKLYYDENIKSSSSVYSILPAKENSYLLQSRNINSRTSSVIHKNNSYHSIIDNNVVTTFLNDIMQNDELNVFHFGTEVKEITKNSVSSAWSFPETPKNPSQLCFENIICNEGEKHNLKKFTPELQIFSSKQCIYCTMSPSTRAKNLEYDKGNQIIPQCFVQTNLVSINSRNNKSEINNNIDTKCKDIHNENELELSAKIVNNKAELLYWKTPTDLYALNKKLLKRFNKDLEERNILFKAKLLTSELLKILFKYQKANKEFESHIQR
ncbi:unnamed protein product [Parnassius apollo]|uniref:(apollo) hypothetical protein n=1 Tax=Parnassius apollo TaxID=110799 RepID=A0A8S3W1K1_PARAO|nr:unnamed protein product [Parnassius apollo]